MPVRGCSLWTEEQLSLYLYLALLYSSAHSDPGTPQSGPGTPHSDGEASGRENQSDDEKWDKGAKSDQSDEEEEEEEEEKRHYSDEERENSDDEGPRNRKSGNPRSAVKDFMQELYHKPAVCINFDMLDLAKED